MTGNPFDGFDDAPDPSEAIEAPPSASASSLAAAPPQPQSAPSNPFDNFGDPGEVPASEGLQPSNASTGFWDSFTRHVAHSYRQGGIGGAATAAGYAKTAAGEPSLGLAPTQSEIDTARRKVQDRKAEEDSFERFHSDGFAARAGAVFGELVGGALQPESLIPVGGEITFAGKAASPVVQMLGGGARVGALNAALDATEQGFDVKSGTRKDFSPSEVGASFALGAGLGGGMHAIGEGVKAFRAYRTRQESAPGATETAADGGGAAGGPQTGQKPSEPVKPAAGDDPGPLGEPVTLDEITIDKNKPAVMPPPLEVAAKAGAARSVSALPDQMLGKIADAVGLVDPETAATGGTIKLPVSINEAAALKAAGIHIDERGILPASEVAGIVAERDRRLAEKQQGPTAPPATAQPVEQPRSEPVASMSAHRVATPEGRSVDVAPIVVEARDLRTSADAGYDATLQPRQRSRAASQAQIRDIATNLDPERLGQSAEADRGAPIVGDDGMVESGNGRLLAIRSAYDQGGEAADRYLEWLRTQGVDVDRYEQPVLVRQRTTELSPEDRRAFTVAANQSSTLSMSASERALADSHILTPSRLDLIRNADDLGAAANHEFRKAFVKALPQAEQGALTSADGAISAEGLARIRNAMLASAYGDSPVLARISEATSDDVKSISNALTAAAPEWARLKSDIAEGRVPREFDLRSDLLEAVSRTSDIRGKGQKLDTFLAQQDAFDRLPGRVEQFMRLFYDPKGRKAVSAQRIADALKFYAEEARKASAERGLDLGLPSIKPEEIQRKAYDRQLARFDDGGRLFDRPRDGTDGQAGRAETQGRQAGRGGRDAGGRGTEGSNGQDVAGHNVEAAQALRAQPVTRRTDPTRFDPNSRFPNRRELAGEGEKPRELPPDATPQEVQNFRVTGAMKAIAERMGRKLEIDRRFSVRGALGEYKTKEGVFRIRQEGDTEVFAHELGHGIDQRLANTDATSADFKTIRDANADELCRLDANTTDPGKKTVAEGLAEFLRSYVTNPAYARKEAPNFAEEFDRLVDQRDPELRSILNDASRMSQIDSGMAPVDVFRTMISPGSQPRGLGAFRESVRKDGMLPTLGLYFDKFYAAVVGSDHWAKRFTDQLREAQFQKTGKPLPEFKQADPYKMLRGLPGARQAALDSIYYGVRPYGSSFKDAAASPAIYDALAKAFDGRVMLIDKPNDPLTKAFSGYLIARRARALYERFKAGELRNPPVRASEAETHAAIADFEKQFPQFVDAANDVFTFNRAMLTKKFESGIIKRDLYETLIGRGDDYVSFARDMSDDRSAGGGGSSVGQERSIIKRLSGSSRQIIDPVHSLIYDAIQTERVIAFNDVLKGFHNLAQMGGEFSGRFLERVPNTELRAESIDIAEGLRAAANRAGLEKADTEMMLRHVEDLVGDDLSATVYRATQTTARGERIAFYWDAGERVALKFGQDEFSKAFFDTVSNMSTSERDLLLAMVGKVNGLFSALITDAPQFAIKNILMDNISRIFIARNTGLLGRVPGASILAGAYTQIFDREFARAYAGFGGLRGGTVAALSRDLAQRQGLGAVAMRPKTISDTLTEVKALMGNPKDLAIRVAESPIEAMLTPIELLRKAVEGTETTGRLGQAKIVYRHLKRQGLSDQEAFQAALYEARDVLDYDRRGSGMYAATKLAVFLNPAIQGTERSWRAFAGDAFSAAMEAYRRGGYSALDEASKSALADAVKNYGMISLGAVATMSYYFYMADKPVYQRASDYLRRKYYIFDAGVDETGKQMIVTVPKSFDIPGTIHGAVEAALDGIRRADPKMWQKVRAALLDGFLPRQMSSFEDAVTSNPMIKTAYEALTGMKLGFDGGAPRPIVPQNLAKLPPEMQYTGTTSWLAKQFGKWFGVSPLMADHVLSGVGGTAGKDANNLVTSLFDAQPNVTVKDAMTRISSGRSIASSAAPGQRVASSWT